MWHLTRRAFKSAYRNTFAIGLRTVMNVFFALLFSAIWHEVRHDQKGIQSLIGLCFMVATNISFGAFPSLGAAKGLLVARFAVRL